MTIRKVRVGAKYVYHPVLLDRLDKPYNIKDGDLVKVVNLRGCPRSNTMGHAHVEHLDGKFGGLVCCNSLIPLREELERLKLKVMASPVPVL